MEVGFDYAEFVLVSVLKSGGRFNEKRVVVQLSIRSDGPRPRRVCKESHSIPLTPHARFRYSCMGTGQVSCILRQ
jgi:hypothetical protein